MDLISHPCRLVLLLLALAYAPSPGQAECTALNETVVDFLEKKVIFEDKLQHGFSVPRMEAVMYVRPEPGFAGVEITATLETLTEGLGQCVLVSRVVPSVCFERKEMQAVLILVDVEQHTLDVHGWECGATSCNMHYNSTAVTTAANSVVRGFVVTAYGPSRWTTQVTGEGCPPIPQRTADTPRHTCIHEFVQPAATPAPPATPPPPREVLDGCTAANEVTVSYGEAKVVSDTQVTDGEAAVEAYMLVRREPGFAGVTVTATMETLAGGRRQSVLASRNVSDYCFKEGTWRPAVMLADAEHHILGGGGDICKPKCNMNYNATAFITAANTVLRRLVVTAHGPSKWATQVTGERCPTKPPTEGWRSSSSCKHELLHPPATPATPATPLSLHDAVTIGVVAALLVAAAVTLLVALVSFRRLTAFFDYHRAVVDQGVPLTPMNQPGTSAQP